jgi:hypothetical protein
MAVGLYRLLHSQLGSKTLYTKTRGASRSSISTPTEKFNNPHRAQRADCSTNLIAKLYIPKYAEHFSISISILNLMFNLILSVKSKP